jgi:hypothetical protein
VGQLEDGERESPVLDPDLALIVERWHELPAAIRSGLAALVRTHVATSADSTPQPTAPDSTAGRESLPDDLPD